MELLTKEDVLDAIEEGTEIDCETWKWGTTNTYVFERKGRHFRFSVQIHSQDGIQFYGPIDCDEVRPAEKIVITWELVS